MVKPIEWSVRRDLLGSDDAARDFVVEVQDDGRARLRFGDDSNGRRPEEETEFESHYRVGNGAIGNVGAEAIAHVLIGPVLAIGMISNPLPAFGGIDAEDIEVARRDAPQAFRTQERAVTAADYATAVRTTCRHTARGGDLPLDRQLAHGVRHGRSPRRRGRGRRLRTHPAPASRALPHGRVRP